MRRIKSDSIGWHVIARGTRRLDLYRDRQDFGTFLDILRGALRVSGVTPWAFALMSNHYHLVLYGTSIQLTACMRRVNGIYSRYHNERYGLVGHAFDGPYKAFRQPSPVMLLRTIAYVLMNPVAAGIKETAEEYEWSSIRDYLLLPGSPLRINTTDVMARVSKDPKEAWETFHRAMTKEATHPKRTVPDRLTRIQVQVQQFEWLLEHAKESVVELSGEDPIEVAVYWAKQCGIAPKSMALALGMENSQSVRKMLWSISHRMEGDPALARRLRLP